MKKDVELRQDILDELMFEPAVDAAHIGVAVEKGVVTLTGHVATYSEKLAAEEAVKRVKGVLAVAADIEVRYPGRKQHADDEIARRAIDVVSWNAALPEGVIKIKVAKGWVTLSGEVDWHFQSEEAEAAVRKLGGVVGVTNAIRLKRQAASGDVKARIEQALTRNAHVEARGIKVAVSDHTVVLEGDVHSWSERSLVERAAWSVPGISVVDNRLHIH